MNVFRGLGYPGQGFILDFYRYTDRYTCDNGASDNVWYYGRNVGTGVTGYVPLCNLVR
jgi:hypothetical protein